jgi:hypothetical protein
MKLRTFISSIFILSATFCITVEANAQAWGFNNNRIAMSADGNVKNNTGLAAADPDDWGAAPSALAMLAKKNLQQNLVHFSYNNWMGYPEVNSNVNQMKISVLGGMSRFGFNQSVAFDVTANAEAALQSLANEIIKSTNTNPLYYIHMGPSEFFYQAVKKVIDAGKMESLKYVYVVSHSGYNNDYKVSSNHHTLTDAINYSNGYINSKRIIDQNGAWSPDVLWDAGKDFSVWYWMRDHQDEDIRWIFERIKANYWGKSDISDAGMIYWLITNDENGSPSKFKQFIGSGINSVPTPPTTGNSINIPGKIEAENYVRFYDTSSGNAGGKYRQDTVDIESTSDNGNGYNIGWIDAGEWLEYDIKVTKTADYQANLRLASPTGNGMLSVELDGKILGTAVMPKNTGGWQVWSTSSTLLGNLTAGNHNLRVQIQSGGFNLNWIDIQAKAVSSSSTNTSSSTQTSSSSAASSLSPAIDQCNTTQQCKNIFGIQATDCKNSKSAQSVCMCGNSACR